MEQESGYLEDLVSLSGPHATHAGKRLHQSISGGRRKGRRKRKKKKKKKKKQRKKKKKKKREREGGTPNAVYDYRNTQ